MQNRIKNKYRSNSKVDTSRIINQTIPDISFNDENYDPLNEYPNLSTEIDFDYTDT